MRIEATPDELIRYWTKKILGSADQSAAIQQFNAFLGRLENADSRAMVNSRVTANLLETGRFKITFTVE